MKLQKENFMTIYVHKSTQVIAFKALQVNERITLSSGVYLFVRKLRSQTLTLLFRHIDGHDYFYALSEMLDSARQCIFILVWVTPRNYIDHSCDPRQGLVVDPRALSPPSACVSSRVAP